MSAMMISGRGMPIGYTKTLMPLKSYYKRRRAKAVGVIYLWYQHAVSKREHITKTALGSAYPTITAIDEYCGILPAFIKPHPKKQADCDVS